MNQTWKNDKKTSFGPILAHLTQFGPHQKCFACFTSNICYALLQATIVCN